MDIDAVHHLVSNCRGVAIHGIEEVGFGAVIDVRLSFHYFLLHAIENNENSRFLHL